MIKQLTCYACAGSFSADLSKQQTHVPFSNQRIFKVNTKLWSMLSLLTGLKFYQVSKPNYTQYYAIHCCRSNVTKTRWDVESKVIRYHL